MDTDDLTIADSWRLLRRIPLENLVWNENLNAWTMTSQAFQGHRTNRRAFSIHLEPVLFQHGLTHESLLLDPAKFFLAAFSAAEARALKQVVERHASQDDPAHAHLVGDKTGAVQKGLKRCAEWVIAPMLPPPAA